MSDWHNGWLVGSRGLFRSDDGQVWGEIGHSSYPVNDVVREADRLLCATMWGLWEVTSPTSRWVQLHDETLTEVLGIAPRNGHPGVTAVSPYGLSFGRIDKQGAARWDSHDDGLTLNERFSNALLALPGAVGRWLVGTEKGALIYDESSDRWERTNLIQVPCRALLQAHGSLWAGTDGAGVWRSDDGAHWSRAGSGLDEERIFALAAAGDGLLAGTLRGVCAGNGVGSWQRSGPALLVSAVAADADGGPWLAGATPGGLWRSDDDGAHWRQVGDFSSVHVIKPPQGTA